MVARLTIAAAILAFIPAGLAGAARPSAVERVSDGVWLVRDEAGNWGGPTMGMTHQRGPEYHAKKLLDLSGLPESDWQAVTQARLSVYFCVRDYSWHDAPKRNGLDEFIEIVLNGKVHRMATGAGLPAADESKPIEQWMRWHDVEIPKGELVRGSNEVVFRLAAPPGKTPDDYLYLGIDNTAAGGNSWVRFGATSPWRQDALTIPGGKGEYMVRLYLMGGERRVEAAWRPAENKTTDPAGILQYAGVEGDRARLEWDPTRLDLLCPLELRVEGRAAKDFQFIWLDEEKDPVKPAVKAGGPQHVEMLRPPLAFVPGGVEFDRRVPIESVVLRGARAYRPLPRRIDMAPLIQAPRGKAAMRKPFCRIEGEQVALGNEGLRVQFSTVDRRLRLASLYHEFAAAEVVRQPDVISLFLVEVAGKRYAGSREFLLRSLAPLAGKEGFAATLECQPAALEAVLSAWIDDELHLGLAITNRGDRPVDLKVAFPHLEGLAVSERAEEDYYFFPWGGGIIADAPAVIRRGYGDHEALFQVMDLFSPARGGGLSIRCEDADGRHKVLALRKHVPGQAEINGDAARTPTADEFKWANSLGSVPGVGLAFEYLRRTRKPGEGFALEDAAIWAHAGDWHAAMRRYAEWCHRVWRFRPYPSRLGPVLNMLAVGWGQDALFRDGKYRTDFIQPRSDCYELMSWWDWSPLGPKGVPIDQFAARLGDGKYREWQAYFVKDPVTGQMMFSNNPGDYDGYNERFGGLPALRAAIQEYKKRGVLVTLYTDPFRVDHNSTCGRKWGKLWGVVEPDGKHRDDYDAWRMCHDVAEYRRWVAETMGRVMRETEADGIRLDEYGHAGSACFSTLHEHTFAERGVTEWQRGTAEATRLVRQAMDQARPGSVLTTEHPGYDFLMQFIDGCLTYDMSVQSTALRPLECNLQRFYFPECKAFELIYGNWPYDPKHHKRLWNAVASFCTPFPVPMDKILRAHAEVFTSRDCEPLIPTLAPYVYANRFTAGEKTICTLYNATGHTFARPALRIELRPAEHVVDLLAGREADLVREGAQAVLRARLGPGEAACLMRLPK